jgi:hypothetical protein
MPARKPRPSKRPAAAAHADPDRLIRQPDGAYRTGDERFGVAQANGSWFVTDQQTADEFGQPRVTGPFSTLNAVRDAIPDARAAPTSIRKPIRQAPATPRKAPATPPKPKTWLDLLSPTDRRRANRLVETLRELGLPDAEDLARARIEGRSDRKLASRIVRARLGALLDGADIRTRALVAEAVKLLADGGSRLGRDLPGWALFETDADGSATDRRLEIEIDRD